MGSDGPDTARYVVLVVNPLSGAEPDPCPQIRFAYPDKDLSSGVMWLSDRHGKAKLHRGEYTVLTMLEPLFFIQNHRYIAKFYGSQDEAGPVE